MNLLQTHPKPKIDQSTKNNANNGNDAELLSASKLLLACGAEISWGSRNEDGRKIDLIISYDHPWFKKERLLVLIQVKSGDSYGKIMPDGFNLKSSAIILAKRTSHDICVVWVDRIKNETYWAYIHPSSKSSGEQHYGKHHSITPAIRFDLARCCAKNLPFREGGKGIILSRPRGDIRDLRSLALAKYRKKNKILNPYLGEIELTHIGWRHMFRKKRSKKRKQQSLEVLMNLDKILAQKPSVIYGTFLTNFILGEYEYRNMEFALIYEDVLFYDLKMRQNIKTKVIIRVEEAVRWPVEWQMRSSLSQEIDRRVVLKSAYHK